MARADRRGIAIAALLGTLCGMLLLIPGLPTLVTAPSALALVFALPGYAVTRALNARHPMDTPETALFTLGLSLSLAVLVGLLLNLLPVGLTSAGWGAALGGLTVGASVVAWLRLAATSPAPARPPLRIPRGQIVMVILAVGLVVVSLGVARLGASVQPHDPFTQLWTLPSANGSQVDVGITNNESQTVAYRLVLSADGTPVQTWSSISLADGATWNQTITLPAVPVRTARQMEADLYKVGDATLYRQTRFQVIARADAPASGAPAASSGSAPSATP